jgi:hypothetical protein
MIKVLADLPAIGKDQKNQQQGFMFRGHDDILNALNPLLAQHGVFVVPDVIERVTAQRTTARGGVMFEVNLHVAYRFYGADGDHILASSWGEGTDSGDKATSKAMTMAFKSVLSQTFAISSAELSDPDGETAEESSREGEPSGEHDTTPSSEDSSGFQAPAAATDKPTTQGLLDQMTTMLRLLDGAFPENPGEGRTWKDTAQDYVRDHFGKESVSDMSHAEGQALNVWLEDQYNEAAREAAVPFGS